jgi:hypothetical protein
LYARTTAFPVLQLVFFTLKEVTYEAPMCRCSFADRPQLRAA